jgi:hypothetical protein
MSYSNYPNGFTAGLTIRGLPINVTNPGQVFFVNSTTVIADGGVGGSNGNPGTYQKPFATIAYAVTRCKANRGDVVMVMPGHTESVIAAATISVANGGVSIIGLGTGNKRPTITLSTAATASIAVSGANVTFKNMIFTANFADITKVFTVTAKYFLIEDCRIQATATNMNFLSIVSTNTTDNIADGMAMIDSEWVEPDLLTESMFNINGHIDGLTVNNNYSNLGVNASNLPIVVKGATGKNLTNFVCEENMFQRFNTANPLLVVTDTGLSSTGSIHHNMINHRDVAAELLVTTTTGIGFFENKATAVADLSGYLLPAADA